MAQWMQKCHQATHEQSSYRLAAPYHCENIDLLPLLGRLFAALNGVKVLLLRVYSEVR
jgi:hypothetical protein